MVSIKIAHTYYSLSSIAMLLGTNLFAEVAECTAVTNRRKMEKGALPRVKNQVLIKKSLLLAGCEALGVWEWLHNFY